MPLAEALALGRRRSPEGETADWLVEVQDTWGDRQALERMTRWCRRYSPTIRWEESAAPESLWLEIQGSAHLFGGEAALARQVASELAARRLAARVAVAETLGAAWAVAHAGALNPLEQAEVQGLPRELPGPPPGWLVIEAGETAAALGPLPPSALRLDEGLLATLDELGLMQIAQVVQLPRAALATRLGRTLLARWDEAQGKRAELVDLRRSEEPVRVSWSLEYPTTEPAAIEFVLVQLLADVAAQLELRQLRLRQLECRLQCETAAGASDLVVMVSLFRPSRSPRYWGELLRLELERRRLLGPVAEVSVQVIATAPHEVQQRRLFEEASRTTEEAWTGLIERLSSRLGREAVLRARLRRDAQAELGVRYEPWLATAGKQRRKSASSARQESAMVLPAWWQRPVRLSPRPVDLPVWSVAPEGPPLRLRWEGREHAVLAARRPERIETGWWRGRAVARDYYQVDTDGGLRLWLFRQLRNGRWYLHGWFE